ncbi:zinc ABC transporter substrate-binding protein [Roseibaca sp. Y0-43]|uniref:zinc ABC transporter substrate-binding protein n=1 Tax=Roseibaca sp. Y0-43 TaxID=2816854 RepID=UPI001D0CD159|nr:zinc ABC transporter substrate-binding protein [Roseibaca sp. Y0-43]MCC1480803.1 zinc ABC transporter substrate-binding protein [Roseibaca sp. Y0-43]
MRYSIALAAAMLGTPLAAQDIRVVTDIPVAHSLVSMVLGDLGAVDLMLDRGANAHSYQLRPSQAQAMAEADIVVWMGETMTPWMGRAIVGLSGDAHAVALLEVEGAMLREFGQAKDAQDDHSHDHADEHAHDHSGLDPHAWLDTRNAAIWVDLIAAELADHMPDHAADFAANAEAAKARITALTAELETILAPAQDMAFVTFHDAYGYFVNQFDLTQAGSIALGDAASPGAQRLAELRAELEADAAVCIFPEAAHDPALVTTMIEGTGARMGDTLDPAGSLLDPGADLYPTLMRNMARSIADCAQG